MPKKLELAVTKMVDFSCKGIETHLKKCRFIPYRYRGGARCVNFVVGGFVGGPILRWTWRVDVSGGRR